MSSPPSSKRRRKRRTLSERKHPTSKDEISTTTDDVTRRTSRRFRKIRRSPSPDSWQDENSITSSTTLNTAFINTDAVSDTELKWQPDISMIAPDDVIKRRRTGSGRKPEVVAVARQIQLCERKFVDDVSDVVCRLSRPLLRRHDIVTSRQHSVLFQNLEKVCEIQCCCPQGKSLTSRILDAKFTSPYPCHCPRTSNSLKIFEDWLRF